MKVYLSIILSFIWVSAIHGQNRRIIESFSLVKSFESKEEMAKPAILSFTFPKEDAPSFLINSALGVDVISLFDNKGLAPSIALFPFVEYNRNTLIGKEQHQFQAGVSFEWLIECKKFTPMLQLDAKYTNDFEKKVKAFQGSVMFSPQITGVTTDFSNFYIPNNIVHLGERIFSFEYIPYLGLETENRFEGVKDSLKGNILRFVARVQSNLFFLPKKDTSGVFLYNLFEFNLDYQFRYEILNTTLNDFLTKNHFLELSLNYTIYKKGKVDVKLGIDYVYGANPSKAFEYQEYWGLSLKIKL